MSKKAPTARRILIATGLAGLMVLAACGGGSSESTSDTLAPTTTVEPEPTTTTTTLPPILAPLTGLPVEAEITRPALVAKIDNHPKALPQWMADKGVDLPDTDFLRPSALYRSSDSLQWDYATTDGTQELDKGDKVGIVSGTFAGLVYEYIGTSDWKTDLAKLDFNDTSRWKIVSSDYKRLERGDTVKLVDDYRYGGDGGAIYSYIGKNRIEYDLGRTDYSDTTRWERVRPDLDVSVLEAGNRWMVSDARGNSYALEVVGNTIEITRSNLNAISVAASMAVGIGKTGIAVSGAG
ncbi:MAG: hypothetical protein RL552_955, partial [Actinomycetota bacterium]